MKRAIFAIGAAGLLWVPLSVLAQDGGEPDTGVQPDAAAADSTVPDAAEVDATVLDSAVSDSAVTDSAATDAPVPDSAAPDSTVADAAVGCGTVTYIGQCQGDSVQYCLGGQLRVVDCVDRYGADATCGLLDCTDANDPDCQGYWCVPTSGSSCTGALTACDVGAVEGCLGGVCATSQTCDPDSFLPACAGTVITSCGYTVNNRDCAEGGRPYVCGPASGGGNACLGLAGAACDVAQGLGCQSPLSCIRGVCGTEQPDAGQQPLDAGPVPDAGTGGEDDGTCGCRAASAGPAALALLALCGVALFRHRRR
ncbi:MAG: hypothetical protein JXR83_00175 [Deltaproteobacteria bacterium]|nr:hypothetical protein [Deltaproteobacteria bacterium]